MKELACRQIEHYALQRELSHKGGRRTFVAKDLRTKATVIVKILQISGASSWDALKLFKREAQILQQLNHYAIPKYKDRFKTEIDGVTSCVLVQEYIPAKSLQAVVESGQLFSEAETIAIARQLLTTLSYLHQQLPAVIHRDIKPSNILFSDRSPSTTTGTTTNSANCFQCKVHLIDFGAVQITASKTSGTVTIVGSYGYMPLEQFLGQTTPASDLYSLGMTLLYLITGTHPAELPQVDGKIQIERLAELSGLSDHFTHWLIKMTEPYAEKRFQSATAALAALTTILQYQEGTGGYYPHLMPATHHVHIRRKPEELTIISDLSTPVRHGEILSSIGVILALFLPFFPMVPLFTTQFDWVSLSHLLFVGWLIVFPVLPILSKINAAVADHEQQLYSFISIHQRRGISAGIAKGYEYTVGNFLSMKRKGPTKPFQSIKLITYMPGHTFRRYYDRDQKIKTKFRISLPSQLFIYAGDREYSLRTHGLSSQEQQWISQELQSFIGLPLQTFRPQDTLQKASLQESLENQSQ